MDIVKYGPGNVLTREYVDYHMGKIDVDMVNIPFFGVKYLEVLYEINGYRIYNVNLDLLRRNTDEGEEDDEGIFNADTMMNEMYMNNITDPNLYLNYVLNRLGKPSIPISISDYYVKLSDTLFSLLKDPNFIYIYTENVKEIDMEAFRMMVGYFLYSEMRYTADILDVEFYPFIDTIYGYGKYYKNCDFNLNKFLANLHKNVIEYTNLINEVKFEKPHFAFLAAFNAPYLKQNTEMPCFLYEIFEYEFDGIIRLDCFIRSKIIFYGVFIDLIKERGLEYVIRHIRVQRDFKDIFYKALNEKVIGRKLTFIKQESPEVFANTMTNLLNISRSYNDIVLLDENLQSIFSRYTYYYNDDSDLDQGYIVKYLHQHLNETYTYQGEKYEYKLGMNLDELYHQFIHPDHKLSFIMTFTGFKNKYREKLKLF